ncbi:MAG: hypothetical protein IKN20_04115, partial [Firmicutes bacterium]|nr:hypothetical protein [Bacillota bacterium]
FLVHSRRLKKAAEDALGSVPVRYRLADTEDLLKAMDPTGEYLDTFFVYDAFSEKLTAYRRENREIEAAIRRAKKGIRERLQREHGFFMTPKFELSVPRSNAELLALAESLPELERTSEDYMNIIFEIRDSGEVFDLQARQKELAGLIEEEELEVCRQLSAEIAKRKAVLAANCEAVGAFDLDLAKCLYAKRHDCVRPQVLGEHRIVIEEGRNLQVEDALKAQKREYMPVSISLADGVTAITGANMGGKTINLKMVTQCALMTQYALFLPAKRVEIGLSNYIHVLIGDSQNVQRGLSSFGSEMEELKEMLDNAQPRSLLMIDEIASGTNPAEGFALTKSFMSYFAKKPFITVITTHFDHAANGADVRNLQVKGLSGADFGKLARELSTANRRQRIEILGKYMDYHLIPVETVEEVPRDALNIAKILGIYDEIIDEARTYLI